MRRWILLEDELEWEAAVESLSDILRDHFRDTRDHLVKQVESGRLVGDIYCELLAPDLRHRLGEHYTPKWLVDLIVEHVQ